MTDDKRDDVPLTVEDAKAQIISAAIAMENLIIVRHKESMTVHVAKKVFEGIDAYAAKEAVDELVASGDARQVPHSGENVKAYKLHQRLLDAATKDTSD